MLRSEPAFDESRLSIDEPAPAAPARHARSAIMASASPVAPPRAIDLPAALVSIVGFWLFYFAIVSLRAVVMGFDDQLVMLGRRIVVSLVGMALTFGLYAALLPFARATLRRQVAAAALLVVPFAALFAGFNYAAFYVYEPMEASKAMESKDDGRMGRAGTRWGEGDMAPRTMIADGTVTWYFFFAAWAALHLAIGYAGRVRIAERQAGAFRAAARDAEIRALRYQVNPHFLFNTLNSLSTLVMRDRPEEAERMILNLATFFRTSLTADAADDLPLAEELRLQHLYLDIEAVRFPDRLRVAVDVPDHLSDACIPGLLLQPLVENAIKHGVSRAARPVTLAIRARPLDGERIEIAVIDDGPAAAPDPADTLFEAAPAGTGTGLRNVRQRLAARFGDEATIRWGRRAGEGFEVVVALPLVRHGC